MRYRTLPILVLLLVFPGFSPGLEAQPRPALELRGGLNLPVGDFGDSPGLDAESLVGIGADILVPVGSRFSVYGGAGYETFGCSGCEGDEGFSTLGVEGGVKLFLRRTEHSVLPWLKAGATYQRLGFTFDEAEGDSDWGLGFQVAAGMDIPLGEVLSFSPAIRYQTSTAKFEPLGLDFISAESDVDFFSLDLGLHIHVGS